MGLLIDTGPLIDLERGTADFERLVREAGKAQILLSTVTAAELLHGVHRADSAIRRGHRERFVEWILARIPSIPFDLEVARLYARLWADLAQQGTPIGVHDTMIAATALTHGLTILTNNAKDFRPIDGLELLVWTLD